MDKISFLLENIRALDPYTQAGMAMGYAKVLCTMPEVKAQGGKKILEELEEMENNFHQGIELDECEILYQEYSELGLDHTLVYQNKRFTISDLRKAFKMVYFEILALVLNMQFFNKYNIGASGRVDYEGYDK